MRTRLFLIVLLGATVCAATPALAEKGDMRVQFGVVYSTPTDDFTGSTSKLEADPSTGFEASFEYMVTGLFGVEPALNFANHDIQATMSGGPEEKLGDVSFTALIANLNFHVLRRERVDLYVGPTVGYVFWGDLTTDYFGPPPETFKADDEFTYGANLGLDIPFGKWALSMGLTYLQSEIQLQGTAPGPALGVDPVLFRLGAAYRF